jgi:hypothetical protein
MYDFDRVTEAYVEQVWTRYGTGAQLRQGFAAWLAEEMNKDDEPPLRELAMAAILKHFPQCTSLRGCSGCPPWPSKAVERPVEERSTPKLTWVSRTFIEWPDPVNVNKFWHPHRWRAVGVRSDGAVYQAVTYIDRVEHERHGADVVKLSEAFAYAYMDRYLDEVKAP